MVELFRTLIGQPIFNLLEVIYGLIPGHDLGIAILIFTAIIRIALYPLVRKQLHHARAMRKLQPELKKIKKAAAGDRQKEARMQMEMYKEHEIKPFSTIGTLVIQVPIFIGLYHAVLKLINDPNSLLTFSYSWVRDLPWIHSLSDDIARFDPNFLGIIDLSRHGLESGGLYFGAIVLALISTVMQYYQSKLMMRDQQDSRKLSVILKESAAGKQVDQAEMTAAVSRGMLYFLPFVTFIFAINIPSALSLYLFMSSAVGFLQQRHILNQDQQEMKAIAEEPVKIKRTTTKKTSPKKKRRR